MERLEDDDAAALEIDPDRVKYAALGDLATATEKARRDAPAIPVCDVIRPATSSCRQAPARRSRDVHRHVARPRRRRLTH